jgi:hypothetical protein
LFQLLLQDDSSSKKQKRGRRGSGKGRGRSSSSSCRGIKSSGTNSFVHVYSCSIQKVLSPYIQNAFGKNMVVLANNIKTGMATVWKQSKKYDSPIDPTGTLYSYLTQHKDAAITQFNLATPSQATNIRGTIATLVKKQREPLVNPDFDVNYYANEDDEASSIEDEQDDGGLEYNYERGSHSSVSSTPSSHSSRSSSGHSSMSSMSLFGGSSPSHHYHGQSPYYNPPFQSQSPHPSLQLVPPPHHQPPAPSTLLQGPPLQTAEEMKLTQQVTYLLEKDKQREEEEAERKLQDLLKLKKAEMDNVLAEYERKRKLVETELQQLSSKTLPLPANQ